MKKLIAVVVVAVSTLFAIDTHAQDYKNAVGVRLGTTTGLSYKHFVQPNVALEGIVSTRWKGIGVTGLVEGHTRFLSVDRLNFIYGAGGHVYHWGDNQKEFAPNNRTNVFGVDGIVGLEYNFKSIPLNISADWKPRYNFQVPNNAWGDEGAISIRYTF